MTALGLWYCKLMHTRIGWPIRGAYLCFRCYRKHPTGW